MYNFVPLHIVSGYSFLKSGLTMNKIATAIKNNDYAGAGITDLNSMYGVSNFAHTLKKLNKPYIVGVDFGIDEFHLSLFAKNEEGYLNLVKLTNSYQKDELTFEKISNHSQSLIAVLETNHGKFLSEFNNGLEISFLKQLAAISSIFKEDFYLGIEVTSKEEVKLANAIRKFANEHTYQCVAFPRIKYLKKDDAIVLKIVDVISKGMTLEEKKAQGQEYFMKIEDYRKIYNAQEIENTNKILLSSSFEISQKRGEMLKFSETDSNQNLKDMTYSSLSKKGLNNDAYTERLDYELSVIKNMGYSDYFLLVQDYVNWAKDNHILVGAGRGSAAGSLVSYLLNITEIDPLVYDLQFERFLNPNRKTMPDIDVDFMDISRDDVVNYMRQKYGQNKVSNITTFQTIQAKQALRDIGRVYEYPERHISLLSKALVDPKLSLAQSYKQIPTFKDLVDSDTYFKEFISLAAKIEGLPRQAGQHAAGIILNNQPLEDVIPVIYDFEGNIITQYEAEFLEEEGFLKMDFLGLRNLTTVKRCLDLINHQYQTNLTIIDIPYDDKSIFDLICSLHNIGLFQIETTAMKRGIRIIKPQNFEDVVALLALNRPGPMQFMKNYAFRRDGKEAITYLHKDLEPILAPTYGIIVYQEQINQITTAFAGFTPGEADVFRRAISKKDKNALASLKEKFIQGAKAKGHDENTSLKVFEQIDRFANYGFNKSHSVVYAVLTCRMAYLKAHYPEQFYTAILETGSNNDAKFTDYVNEMNSRGIKVLAPSINTSGKTFIIKDKALLFPLTMIKGINDIVVNNIIDERNKNGLFKDFFDFATRMYGYNITETQISKLIDSGAFDCLHNSRTEMSLTIKSALQFAELNYSESGQLNIGIPAFVPPIMNKGYEDPLVILEKEYDVLGIMLSNNPLRYKRDLLVNKGVVSISEIVPQTDTTIAGIIKAKKVINTKKGSMMAFIKIFDQSAEIEVTIFPTVYEKAATILDKNNIVVISGHLEEKDGEVNFIANDIEKLEE
jgi:DNA polymerase-3 subunit alpha